MVKNSWIKLYHEILSDSKMGRMNDHLFRRTIELFLLAGQEGKDGILPDIDGIAWSLHTTTKDIQTTINSLMKLNIVEERINPLEVYLGMEPKKRYAIKHFAFRQKSEQTKSESNRAYYEKQKLKKTEIQTESNSEIQTEIQYTDKDIDIDKEKNKNKREIREREDKKEIQTEKQKPTKNHHGEFQHVLLTADEFFKLQEKFGWDGSHDWIRRLDEYLENNQKKHYDSHYLTILHWARKDEEKQQQPIQQPRLTPSQIGRMLDEMEQKKTEQVVDL